MILKRQKGSRTEQRAANQQMLRPIEVVCRLVNPILHWNPWRAVDTEDFFCQTKVTQAKNVMSELICGQEATMLKAISSKCDLNQ